jgi:hypothetical protein
MEERGQRAWSGVSGHWTPTDLKVIRSTPAPTTNGWGQACFVGLAGMLPRGFSRGTDGTTSAQPFGGKGSSS